MENMGEYGKWMANEGEYKKWMENIQKTDIFSPNMKNSKIDWNLKNRLEFEKLLTMISFESQFLDMTVSASEIPREYEKIYYQMDEN